jgi:hypothetical protein
VYKLNVLHMKSNWTVCANVQLMRPIGIFVLTAAFFALSLPSTFGQVGISNTTITPDASSVLELRSTNSGFLPPRMTALQRDAIVSPATGLLVFNTTSNQLNYYTGTVWQAVSIISNLTGDVSSVGSTTTIGAGKVTNAMLAGSIDLTSKVTSTLPVANGGTGQSSALVQGGVMYGASSTATGVTAAGSAGQVLRSAGTGAPTWSSAAYPASAGAAGNILRSDGTNFVSTPVTHNQSTTGVARTVNTTTVRMMGYGTTITPVRSGTLLIMVSGDLNHPAAAEGGQIQIAYGTGTAPVNGATQTGITTGSIIRYLNSSGNQGANSKVPFSIQSIVTGLVAGTSYWIDLQGASTNTGVLSVNDVTISIVEL